MHPQRTEPQWRVTPDCRGMRRAKIWSMGSYRGARSQAFSLLASRHLRAHFSKTACTWPLLVYSGSCVRDSPVHDR